LKEHMWTSSFLEPIQISCADSDMLSYLKGLDDAGVPGAGDLIVAVHKFKKIEVWIDE